MSYRRLTVCLAASAALALTTAAAATSAAGATSHSISASAPAGLHPNVVSDYLAGYTTTQIGIGRASASFTVPTLSCPTADTQGTALGIRNEPTSGSPTLLSIVFLACVSGGPQLTTQVTAGGAANFGSANAGDRIKVLMTQTSTKVTATLTDVTQAVTIKASGPPVPDNTVTFGSFPLFAGGLLPVANFRFGPRLGPVPREHQAERVVAYEAGPQERRDVAGERGQLPGGRWLQAHLRRELNIRGAGLRDPSGPGTASAGE
jgi:hypothetical protein